MHLRKLVIFSTLFLNSCAGAPVLSWCILDPDNGLAYCSKKGEQTVEKPISEMKGYVALSPDDTQALFEWIKRRKDRCKP